MIPEIFLSDIAITIELAVSMAALAGLLLVHLFRRLGKQQEELARLRAAVHHAETLGGIGSWRVDVKKEKLIWSDRVFAIHARPISKGAPTLEQGIAYYHPDDRDLVQQLVERAISHGIPFEFSARLLAEDGRVRQVISRGMCQMDEGGEARMLHGIFIETAQVVKLGKFNNDNAGDSQTHGSGVPG